MTTFGAMLPLYLCMLTLHITPTEIYTVQLVTTQQLECCCGLVQLSQSDNRECLHSLAYKRICQVLGRPMVDLLATSPNKKLPVVSIS